MSVDGPLKEELEQRTVRVRITGRVQGVYYRAWTERTARALGVSGWVRNRSDGSVEALFSGPAAPVAEMLQRCREGPPAAQVDEVAAVAAIGAAAAGFALWPAS